MHTQLVRFTVIGALASTMLAGCVAPPPRCAQSPPTGIAGCSAPLTTATSATHAAESRPARNRLVSRGAGIRVRRWEVMGERANPWRAFHFPPTR